MSSNTLNTIQQNFAVTESSSRLEADFFACWSPHVPNCTRLSTGISGISAVIVPLTFERNLPRPRWTLCVLPISTSLGTLHGQLLFGCSADAHLMQGPFDSLTDFFFLSEMPLSALWCDRPWGKA